jgi:predicted RNase H-like nuclease
MSGARETPRCAGIDGCPGGLVVVSREGASVVTDLAPILSTFAVVGIDMPIGLPASGRRLADVEARRMIGARRSSVFPAPPRDVLALADDADGYRAVNESSKRRHGTGISKQTFNLLTRIKALDELVRPELEDRLAEVHPECSFRMLAGRELASKHTATGRAERRVAATEAFGPLAPLPRGATEIDLLDAYAVLWSAERFAAGCHVCLGDGARDERGLVMRIVV